MTNNHSNSSVLVISLITLIVSILAISTGLEQYIRITGLVFQIFGIVIVIWGIWETQESFGLPSFRSKCKNKLKSLITKAKYFFGKDRVLKEYHLIFNSENAIDIYGPHTKYKPIDYETGTNHTVESLAEILKVNINSIQERISQTQKEINEEFQKTRDNLNREEKSRQDEDNKIRVKLLATSTGGFHISIIGAILLCVGVFLSTVPNEIICLFFSKEDIATHPIPNLLPGISIHLT